VFEYLQDIDPVTGTNYQLKFGINATDTSMTLEAFGGGTPDFSALAPGKLRVTIDTGVPATTENISAQYDTFDRVTGVISGMVRDFDHVAAHAAGTTVNLSFSGTPYSILLADECAGWHVDGTRQVYGRHTFTTGVTDPLTMGCPQSILVTNTIAFGEAHAVLDVHPGAREITFDGFAIYNCGSFGIQARGKDCSYRNGKILGATRGIYVTAGGDGTVLENIDIRGADYGLYIDSAERVRARFIYGRDITTNFVVTDRNATYASAGGVNQGMILRDMQLEGNPSGAAYAMGPFWSADWDVDWASLRAPDATTFRGGYVNTIASDDLPHHHHCRRRLGSPPSQVG
jgi:hypothetical protein